MHEQSEQDYNNSKKFSCVVKKNLQMFHSMKAKISRKYSMT